MSNPGSRTLRLTPAAALAAVTAALSATLFIASVWPASRAAKVVAVVLPIAEVHADRADRALEVSDWRLAERESLDELEVAPMRVRPWMRLAYIDAQAHGGAITGQGVADIQHSFDFAPFDRLMGPWRLAFTYDHWDEATPSIRRAALDETQMLWRSSSDIQALPKTLPNPAGRLAVTMALDNLKAGVEP